MSNVKTLHLRAPADAVERARAIQRSSPPGQKVPSLAEVALAAFLEGLPVVAARFAPLQQVSSKTVRA